MDTKPTKRSAERKEKFIQAGLEIFLENGYENTSLTDIIKKSGGSLASVYKFFENKEGLFRAIVERGFDDFRTQIDEKIDLSLSHKLEDFLIKFASIFFDIICDKENHANFKSYDERGREKRRYARQGVFGANFK